MLRIAFFTLLERKVIGYTQFRKGPNKTLVIGIIQPIADAIKLISKETNLNSKSNFVEFMLTPALNIICSLAMWISIPVAATFGFIKIRIMFLVRCISINTLIIIKIRWTSNSNYAFIGIIRGVAQIISYEINFIMIIMIIISLAETMTLANINEPTYLTSLAWVTFPLITLWIITILAETNRTPFDFAEGESELISGFNVEYGGPSFITLFLAEYSRILLMRAATTCLFVISDGSKITFYVTMISTCTIFIWARTTLPRFRYDKLMKTNWTQILPITTVIMFLTFPIKMYWTK